MGERAGHEARKWSEPAAAQDAEWSDDALSAHAAVSDVPEDPEQGEGSGRRTRPTLEAPLDAVWDYLVTTPEGGDWLSVVGGRFKVGRARLQHLFLLSHSSKHDAWVSILPHRNIYIENLGPHQTAEQLRSLLSEFGDVCKLRIVRATKARTALVKFRTITGAATALNQLSVSYPEWGARSADRPG